MATTTPPYRGETNPLGAGGHPETQFRVYWDDDRLDRVTRIRFLTDRCFPLWDLSYCYGQLKDGTWVDIQLPFDQLHKKKSIKAQIVEWAKADGVYAKGIGIIDALSTLV